MLVGMGGLITGGGFPTEYWDPATENIDQQTTSEARVGIQFKTDGDIFEQLTVGVFTESYSDSGFNWVTNPPPGTEYWIRVDNSGPTTTSGDLEATWLKVQGSGASNRHWYLINSSTPQAVQALLRVRIATDSGGSNVVVDTGTGVDRVLLESDTT